MIYDQIFVYRVKQVSRFLVFSILFFFSADKIIQLS